jgi:hypothetical protein
VKTRLSIGLMALAAVAAAFLAAHGPPVGAQPVASIALPPPGSTVQLYPGCNNISLTFSDGTPCQTVVQAVTPAGAVETLWRFNPSQNRFEGYSPAYPQASDLQSVYFLDAVWLCVQGAPTTGPQPAPTLAPTTPAQPTTPPPPTVAPTAAPTVTPSPSADLTVTHLFATASPAGDIRARVTNNGPDTLTNVDVQLSCSANVHPYGGGIPYGHGSGFPITVNLSPGQTGEFGTGISVNTSSAWYDVSCTVQSPFNDPNPGNNSHSRTFPTTDLAVTDLFPTSLPQGDIRARVTSNGPDSLTNAEVQLSCSVNVHPYGPGSIPYGHGSAFPITVSLNPGQTGEFPTGISVNTTQAWSEVTCTVQTPFDDPNPTNDSYPETFPPPP